MNPPTLSEKYIWEISVPEFHYKEKEIFVYCRHAIILVFDLLRKDQLGVIKIKATVHGRTTVKEKMFRNMLIYKSHEMF